MKRPSGRPLPSTINLTALVTVARTGNVTQAARELFLTQSAVSRQIKDLEDFVGMPLFVRRSGELSLTPQGQRYVMQIKDLLKQIEHATLDVQAAGLATDLTNSPTGMSAPARLTVSCQISLAVKWLLPCLAEFGKQHPNIFVNVQTHVGQVDMKRLQADMLLIFREGLEPGWTQDVVASGGGCPVCTPALLEKTGQHGLAALKTLPLLHQQSPSGGWTEYFQQLDEADLRSRPGPCYSLLTMGLQAALAGMGCAILPDFVVQEELEAGRLIKIHDVPLRKHGAYMLMVRTGDGPHTEIVRDEVAMGAQTLDAQARHAQALACLRDFLLAQGAGR